MYNRVGKKTGGREWLYLTHNFSIHSEKNISKELSNVICEQKILTYNQCSSLYRNRSIDLQSKSFDWFLYDGKHWSLMG